MSLTKKKSNSMSNLYVEIDKIMEQKSTNSEKDIISKYLHVIISTLCIVGLVYLLFWEMKEVSDGAKSLMLLAIIFFSAITLVSFLEVFFKAEEEE